VSSLGFVEGVRPLVLFPHSVHDEHDKEDGTEEANNGSTDHSSKDAWLSEEGHVSGRWNPMHLGGLCRLRIVVLPCFLCCGHHDSVSAVLFVISPKEYIFFGRDVLVVVVAVDIELLLSSSAGLTTLGLKGSSTLLGG